MSSNILAGERRWASARRTGMTVLGKVAVPKPLNLPSQKLENHGMDPNVDIVPKGSIGWGSRPSSSASNPWGSSPTAEGGRPSSSGSRPSTAGSEITHDHGGNAWGPSSRPSSASGISASNQTSLTSLRPNSAETRPASAQMSRFAEQHTDSVVAHHPAVSSERAESASSSDKQRFSLSTGDFPTLNSAADNSLKSSDLRDQGSHSRPSSSGGAIKKDNNNNNNSDISQAEVDNGTVNAWKRDVHRNNDETHPRMDNWHGEPPRYHNPNERPPPHFDGWRGPSMNHPGVWYQGIPPGPPPYGPPPGGFPVEPPPPYGPPPGGYPVEPPQPFSFYCPRVPPSGLPNSQPVPPTTRPGGGPMGHHPKNGEIYRPPIPDAFIRPGMQFRPGFYPMPFEGYYGPPPPMGYCNPNELEVQFNGMPPGPHAYNRYPDPSKNVSGNNKRFLEKAEPNHFNDVQEHVILKKHNDAKQNYPNPMKRRSHHQPVMGSRTKEWGGADYDNEGDMYSGPSDARGGSDSLTIRSGPYGSEDNVLPVDTMHLKKLEMATSPLSGDGGGGGGKGGPTLLQKIEGLNEKVRTSDGRNESSHSSKWDEQKGTTGAAIIGEITVPLVDKTSHVTAAPRRGYGVGRGKTANYNKQNFNGSDEADGWQKKLVNSVQPSDISSTNKIDTTVAVVVAQGLPENQEAVDATDTHTQRLKMREMVKQRALKLHKEEEERTREQKAKALAKLEELNRRNNNNTPTIQNVENVKTHYESSRTTGGGGGEWGVEVEVEEQMEPPSELPPKTTTTVLDTPSLPLKEEPLLTDGGGGGGDRDCIVSPQSNEVTNNKQKKNGGVAPRDVVPGFDSKTPDALHVGVESSSSSQQRRRSNKNMKNKHNKTDDFQSTGVDVTKPPPPPPEISIQTGDKGGGGGGGGAQGGGNGVNHHHHQKPQKSSRFGRNQPSSARFSDNVVWAPVHSQNKTDPTTTTETGSKSLVESAITAKNDDQLQNNNNTKNKRAEMERYVPKPVAKELAQQSISIPDEVAEKVEPEFKSSDNVGSFTESPVEGLKHYNNKQQTKAAGGGWRQRQRGSTSSFKSNSRNQQSTESELTNTKTEEQSVHHMKPNATDDARKTEELSVHHMKPNATDDARKTWNDSGAENNTGRAKRHVPKGDERITRNDREHEKNNSGGSSIQKSDYNKTHTQLQDPKFNPIMKSSSSSSKENRGFEDRPSSSHWQPKSNLTQNLVGGGAPEEHTSHDVPKVNPLVEGTVSQRRENKVTYSSKGHSHAIIEDESGIAGSDESQSQSQSQIKQQQHFSSDYRRGGGGGRYQNAHARSGPNRDLNHERHGGHYEYQPMIPGKKRFENTQENDGSHDVGPRYKERGGGGGGQHSRRGGSGRGGGQFRGNNNNNVQVGAGYG